MAHIDNLVAAIPDEDLRRALQAAVRKLTGGRQFGLVFNEHNPESVLLYKQQSVRRGSKVMVMRDGTADRTDTDETGVWVVTPFPQEQHPWSTGPIGRWSARPPAIAA